MKIGLLKEIKDNEFRVGLTPGNVADYCHAGHTVLVEAGAGEGSGFPDEEYEKAGARLFSDPCRVWEEAQMVVKVKEPVPSEYGLLQEGQILYTYLHLADNLPLTQVLLEKKVTGIAYETIVGKKGGLPCLAPMSYIAGRLSIQEGANYLKKIHGGSGVLLSGVPGVPKGNILILGGGNVGTNAAKMALGMGGNVTILDISLERLAYLDDIFQKQVSTLYASRSNILFALGQADLVVGAVLVPGAKAPVLIQREDLSLMKKGSVIVDVAIDQGGNVASSHPTTHADPIFQVDGITHYCVTNMPGAVPRTSTIALTNATLPYGLALAEKGVEEALKADSGLLEGLNCYQGRITYQGVADAFSLPYTDPATLI